ncbi:MAG: glutathione S-transferase family protein, partial [Polyangiaceae bacterium]|nr:glutathione S-transferase family protein [Polyangiaceae bacterium]
MGRLIEGRWSTEWYSPDEEGRFQREATRFRDRIVSDGSTPYAPDAGRYHLYVSYACPWAHRTLVVRALRGLERAVSVSVVHPIMTADGWGFDADHPDAVGRKPFLRDVYLAAQPGYTGRVTVPVLWDKLIRVNYSCRSATTIPAGRGLVDAVRGDLAVGVFDHGPADRSP